MTSRGSGRILFFALTLLATLMFTALGLWQLQRRVWKLALITHVEQRLHAQPTAAPGPGDWSRVTREHDEYRRVVARGLFRNDAETLVRAVTERGPGYWVVTPFVTGAGTILVNRGFVPTERRERAARRAGEHSEVMTITGLLRLSEPDGGFLRRNDPRAELWYSRDIAAIARARDIGTVAPYFIDADANSHPGEWPLGGLTVVTFRNAHLVYALTWFALAGLSAWGAWLVVRSRR